MTIDRALLRRILSLGTPVVLGVLSSTIMGLIDLMMVGRLGAIEMAAVGLSSNLLYAVIRAMVAVGQGVQAIVSRRYGEDRRDQIGEVVRVAQSFGLLTALPLMVVVMFSARGIMGVFVQDPDVASLGAQYMFARAPEILFILFLFVGRGFFEGIGRTGVPLVAGLTMLGLNVFLNWVFIFGNLGFPELGVRGAGLASAIAAFCGMVLLLSWSYHPALRGAYDQHLGFSLDRGVLGTLWRVAWPNALRVFLVIMAFGIFLAILGRIGTLELAASTGVIRITSFSFMPALGIGTAAGVLVGQALGRSDVAMARRVGWHAVLLSSVFMASMGVLFITVPEIFLRLFTDDPEIIEVGRPIQRILGLVQLFDALGLTLASAIMGAGQTRYVMLADVGTGYLVFLPLAWWLGLYLGLGALGAWFGAVAWFLAFAVAVLWQWQWGDWYKTKV